MLATINSKNQITLPEAATVGVDAADYFDVSVESGRIVLTPVRLQNVQAVREKLEQRGITEQDITDAVAWARHGRRADRDSDGRACGDRVSGVAGAGVALTGEVIRRWAAALSCYCLNSKK